MPEEKNARLELTCRELGAHKDCSFKTVSRTLEEMIIQYEEHFWREHKERLSDGQKEQIRRLARRIRPI